VGVVILGAVEEEYRALLSRAVKHHPGRVGGVFEFDLNLARQVYAGADFLLMPSRYEPCGLAQMIALAYGTIPIVHHTGGLVDTVVDYDDSPERGNGFLFTRYTAGGLVEAVRRAIAVYRKKDAWTQLRRTAMASRFTWDAAAGRYLELYQRAVEGRLARIAR